MSAVDWFARYQPPAETAERQTCRVSSMDTGSSQSATPGRQAADGAQFCRSLPPPAGGERLTDMGNVVAFCQSANSASLQNAERLGAFVYEGEIPERWAAAFHQLCECPCPDWMTAAQWQRHIDAAGALVGNWSAAIERLGWPVQEVLGVDPRSPGSAWDTACLLSALVGVRVGALDKHSITIVFNDGGRRKLGRNAGKWVYL